MPSYPGFLPVGGAQTPDLARAAYLQGNLEQERWKAEQERMKAIRQMPDKAYQSYMNITETNPLADQLRKWQGRGSGGPSGGVNSSGTPNLLAKPPQSAAPPGIAKPAGGWTQPGAGATIPTPQMTPTGSAAMPGANLPTPGAPAPTPPAGGGGAFSKVMGKAGGPLVGGLLGAGITAATGGSVEDVVTQGAGGAATGALMTSAPALAAAGPAGWAGLAGLAALSLYGMMS